MRDKEKFAFTILAERRCFIQEQNYQSFRQNFKIYKNAFSSERQVLTLVL